MPKVNRNNRVRRETLTTRVTVVDPPRRFKNRTEIVLTGTQPTVHRLTTRQLRSRRIEVHIVQRVPLPNLNPALPHNYPTGGLDLFEELAIKSEQESRDRFRDPSWLSKLNLEQIAQAFPPSLRDHSYWLKYHLRVLHITGLIDNLGPHTRFDPIAYLEATAPGIAYLQTIVKDNKIADLYNSPGGYEELEGSLIGRIYLQQSDRLEEELFEFDNYPDLKNFCWDCWLQNKGSCKCEEEEQAELEAYLAENPDSEDEEEEPDSPTPDTHPSLEHPGRYITPTH